MSLVISESLHLRPQCICWWTKTLDPVSNDLLMSLKNAYFNEWTVGSRIVWRHTIASGYIFLSLSGKNFKTVFLWSHHAGSCLKAVINRSNVDNVFKNPSLIQSKNHTLEFSGTGLSVAISISIFFLKDFGIEFIHLYLQSMVCIKQ